jgi:hypothetical protein
MGSALLAIALAIMALGCVVLAVGLAKFSLLAAAAFFAAVAVLSFSTVPGLWEQDPQAP